MKVQLVRTRDGLSADSAHDEAQLETLYPGDVVMAEIKRSRNPAFHRKAFAMLQELFSNQEHFEDFDKFREWLQIKAGVAETSVWPDGSIHVSAKSLSFENMDDLEFERVYQALITAAYESGYEWVLERYA